MVFQWEKEATEIGSCPGFFFYNIRLTCNVTQTQYKFALLAILKDLV